jgi:hypothetical protein
MNLLYKGCRSSIFKISCPFFTTVAVWCVCVEEEINGGERPSRVRNGPDTAISPLLVFLKPCDNPQMWIYSCSMMMAMMVPESYVYKHILISLPTLGGQQIMTLLLLKWKSLAGITMGYGMNSWGSNPGRSETFIFSRVQTSSKAHPASYPVGTDSDFHGGKAVGA